MKSFAVLVANCVLCGTAIAQTPDCKSVSNPDARLTCYDKAAAPATASATAKPRLRAVPPSKVDAAKYVDSISTEEARVNARLKNICRSC